MVLWMRRLLQIGSSIGLLLLGHVVFVEATAQAGALKEIADFALGVAGISVDEIVTEKVHEGFQEKTGLSFSHTLQLAGADNQDIVKLPTIYFANRTLFHRVEEEIGKSGTVSEETLQCCQYVLDQNNVQITGSQWGRTGRIVLANLLALRNHEKSLREDQTQILYALRDILSRKSPEAHRQTAMMTSQPSEVDLYHL